MIPAPDEATSAGPLLGPAPFAARLDEVLDPAYRLATAMLLDHASAAVAVEEAALQAWRRSGELLDSGRFRPWFLSIVVRRCTAGRRSWWSRLRAAASPEETPPPDELTTCARLVDKLDSQDRAALFCLCYLELPTEEVAAVLHESKPGVRSRLQRAVALLRPGIEPAEEL
jgi:DNA-directed RNA polymerase specialized sigma24 family protein